MLNKLKNRNNMKKLKKEKGITLIALVITIIVLLILAGVSIAMLTGDNGILTQAQHAKEENTIASEKEAISLAYIGALSESDRNDVNSEDLNKQFELNGIKANAKGMSPIKVIFTDSGRIYNVNSNGEVSKSIVTTNGVIETKWLKDDTNNVSETANAPVIKSDLPEGTTMKLVKYDGTNWADGTDYNYIAGTGTEDNTKSKWANAEVTIDNVKSYFVWIPRYAYRIVYFDTPEHKEAYMKDNNRTEGIVGYSDSRGLVDKNGNKIESSSTTMGIDVGDYFMVHPAFTNDSANNYENGGWDEELPGIWVGKYETSLVNKVDGSNIKINSDKTGNIVIDEKNNTDKAIAVQNNMNIWVYCSIGNMYTSAKAYSANLNSHMLKNSEWGAVAYLTESKYGRNGTEVTQNKNYSTVGRDIITNVGQSTTGNETGIYDLSGGIRERVAAYYTGGISSILNNGSSMLKETNKKYVTVYTEDEANIAYKIGDATYETSGWHDDFNGFTYDDCPFWGRGGFYNDGSAHAGVFYGGGYTGWEGSWDYTFRMCLAVK